MQTRDIQIGKMQAQLDDWGAKIELRALEDAFKKLVGTKETSAC